MDPMKRHTARVLYGMLADDPVFVLSMIAHSLVESHGETGGIDDIGFGHHAIGEEPWLNFEIGGHTYRIIAEHVSGAS